MERTCLFTFTVFWIIVLKCLLVKGCGTGCSIIKKHGNPWIGGDGLYHVHTSCVLQLDKTPDEQPYKPRTISIRVDLDTDISAITQWTFAVKNTNFPSRSVSMENIHYINMNQLPLTMEFQMSYPVGSPVPTGQCHFPSSGNQQTTTTRATTTRGQTTRTTQRPTTTTENDTSPKPENYDICANYPTVKAYTGSGYNLYEVLCKSILFFEAQRSGDLPADNRVPWRFDSTLNDGKDRNVDLTGGWFDAGDMVKFGYPMASSTTVLLWGLLQWRTSYSAAGQLPFMLDSVRWALDYFKKCWKPDQNKFYAQVGNGDIDHSQFVRPEDLDSLPVTKRPSYFVDSNNGGSDVTADTASALALGYLVFKDSDPAYAGGLLSASKSLFQFANSNRKPYSDSVSDAKKFYASYCCGMSPSDSYGDELTQAALWLYKATGEETYRTTAQNLYAEFNARLSETPWSYDWRDKRVAVNMLMFDVTKDSVYSGRVKSFLQSWKPGGSVQYTPKGLAWRLEWSPLRYVSNVAFISLLALDKGIISSSDISTGNVLDPYKQIKYILGDSGRSFIVGFGNNPPTRPHHKSSTCAPKPASCDWNVFNSASDNYFKVYGALVGGPDNQDNYLNDRKNVAQSEVACDYNAGFQSAIAGMIAIPGGSK